MTGTGAYYQGEVLWNKIFRHKMSHPKCVWWEVQIGKWFILHPTSIYIDPVKNTRNLFEKVSVFFLQGKSMASQKYSHNQISIVHCQKAQCAPSPNTQWYRNLEIDFLTFHQRRRCFFHSLIAFFNMHTRESETKIVRILRLLRKCKILTRMMGKMI